MKIVEQTQTKLILRMELIGPLSVGVSSVLIVIVSVVFGNLTSLSCNRIESNHGGCQLVRSGLLGTENRTIPLNELQGAKFKFQRSSQNRSTKDVVLILTNKGEEPLTISLGSNFDEKQVSEINYFVANPGQKSLIIEEDSRLFAFIFGIFSTALVFLVPLVDGFVIICTLDKTLGNFTLKRQGLFGTKFIQHQLQEIKDVELEFSEDKRSSRIAVVLVSDERIHFTSFYTTKNGNNKNKEDKEDKEKTIQCIRQFLNLGV